MLRAWLPRAAGLLVGASASAIAASFVGDYPWWVMAAPLMAGNAFAAGLAALLLLLPCALPTLRGRLAAPGVYAWTGFALGLVPLPAATRLLDPPAAHYAGAALALALALAIRRKPWPAPGTRALVVGALLCPLIALAFAWHHNQDLKTRIRRLATQESALPTAPADAPSAPAGAPDLILISVDTLRADAIVGERPAGYELPWFDALRAGGVWWDYALSSSNQTVPGHAGMLMGCDAMGTGVRWNRDLLPGVEHGPVLSELLREAGFRTLGVISNDLLSAASGFGRGFEYYDDSTVPRLGSVNAPLEWLRWNSWLGILLEPRAIHGLLIETQYYAARRAPRSLQGVGRIARGRVTSDQALAALDAAYAQDRPFFFFLHYFDPHQPYGAPPPYAGRLTSGLPPMPPEYAPSVKEGLFGLDEIARAGADLAAEDPARRAAAEAAIRRFHLTYLERIMFLDAQLQRVQERMDASGRPYAILLTADHGEHFGEHGAVLHGQTLWEEVVRVPLILYGAGVPAGAHGDGVPALEDVAPTLLALAGLAPPDALAGRILHREGAGEPGRAHVATDDSRIAWRQDGWKALGRWTGEHAAEATAVFDLSKDPQESLDRLASGLPASLRERLAAFLTRDRYEHKRRVHDYGHELLLGALGYTGAAATD